MVMMYIGKCTRNRQQFTSGGTEGQNHNRRHYINEQRVHIEVDSVFLVKLMTVL